MTMRVSCLQDNLSNALKAVGKTVTKKSSTPVLSHVHIGTENGRLYLETSENLDKGLRVYIGVRVEEDGGICVPYAEFSKFVSKLSPERIDLNEITRTLSLDIACGASKATFKGITGSDFPIITVRPTDDEAMDWPQLIIPAHKLLAMLKEVQYAASKYDDRPVLNAILFKYDTDTLKLIGCDGFRLGYTEHKFESPSFDGSFNVIVPLDAIEKFKAIFADEIKGEDDVHILLSDDRMFICAYGIEYSIFLLDGAYPDYTQLGFSNNTYTVYLDPISLGKLLDRAEVFSDSVEFKVDKEKRIVCISAESSELGTTEGVLDANIEGEPIRAYYNIKRLADMLGTVRDYRVRFDFKVSSTSYIMKMTQGTASYHLLMPEFRKDR